jgi:tetratricopeptide (TPR) repeat protein
MLAKLSPALLMALAALTAADGARAQQSGASAAKAANIPQAVVPGAPREATHVGEGPDESGLRYYARLGQTARVAAETKRLQQLYPNWRVPDDIYAPVANDGVDEEPLWDLFAADRVDELVNAIERRISGEPGWQPSKDLLNKVQAKVLRRKIMAYWQDGQWRNLVELVKGANVIGSADVDILWAIAEAHSKIKQTSETLAIYQTILKTNKNSDQRLATVQKAMGTLRMAEVETLVAMATVGPDGKDEFAPISIDLTRARMSAFLHDEAAREITGPELDEFKTYAEKDPDPNQPALAAWYHYKRREYRDALDWFKLALEHGGDAMVAHGLALTLQNLEMKREAEEVAYAWREPLVNNSILFIDILERDLTKPIPPYIEPARLLRYGQVAMETTSGQGAQALAWYAYNSCQFEVAHEWFRRAVAWHPKEPTAYGYALVLKRLKKSKEYVEIINRYDGLYRKVIDLVFPDDLYHPPTPCETDLRQAAMAGMAGMAGVAGMYGMAGMAGQAYGAQQFAGAGFTAPQPYGQPPLQMQNAVQDPARLFAWGRVPLPGAQGAMALNGANAFGQQQQPVKLNRAEFPISVSPENDLRYPSPGAATAGFAGAMAREPLGGPWPLVARRVPGIGPMPYERYGFTLLPGWQGQTMPSNPPASAQIAPAGTLWAKEPPEQAPIDAQTGMPVTGAGAAAGVVPPGAARSAAPIYLPGAPQQGLRPADAKQPFRRG